MSFAEQFDVLVVGAGHAGCEASVAAARMGLRTALLTLNLDLIAQMSCNPAIGGIAKGHLVREIDALGGIMGEVADASGIQFRLLNTSRGPAVWSPRAQCDKRLYRVHMRALLDSVPNLILKQAEVVDVLLEAETHLSGTRHGASNGMEAGAPHLASEMWDPETPRRCVGLKLRDGSELRAKAVVITTGTFLNGLIHCGEQKTSAGRTPGWRHVAVPSAYVAHVGGVSFGPARTHLLRRNLEILAGLHPGYHPRVATWMLQDPLAASRRRIDLLRWQEGRYEAGSVLLVAHGGGGGTARIVEERSAEIRGHGLRPILLTASAGLCQIGDGLGQYPNLRFRLPAELPAVIALLLGDRPVRGEMHHLLGHDHSVMRLFGALSVPYSVWVHDYAWLCPRISLVQGEGRYCGEPAARSCEICVRRWGRAIEDPVSPTVLRARSARDLAHAAEVIVPSQDVARRLRRHFPRNLPACGALGGGGSSSASGIASSHGCAPRRRGGRHRGGEGFRRAAGVRRRCPNPQAAARVQAGRFQHRRPQAGGDGQGFHHRPLRACGCGAADRGAAGASGVHPVDLAGNLVLCAQ